MLPHVFAYLDLASGSMIVQAAIAGIVVVPVMFRNKIRTLLGRNKPSADWDQVVDSEAAPIDAGVTTDAVGTDAAGSDRS